MSGLINPARSASLSSAKAGVEVVASPLAPAGTLKVVHGPAFFDWLAKQNRIRWQREG